MITNMNRVIKGINGKQLKVCDEFHKFSHSCQICFESECCYFQSGIK